MSEKRGGPTWLKERVKLLVPKVKSKKLVNMKRKHSLSVREANFKPAIHTKRDPNKCCNDDVFPAEVVSQLSCITGFLVSN